MKTDVSKRLSTEEFIDLIEKGADLVIPIANGEPHRLLDYIGRELFKIT